MGCSPSIFSYLTNYFYHSHTNNVQDRRESEQLGVNEKLFSVIRKKFTRIQEKLEDIEKLLGQNPKPDINAQDSNDDCNTALHMAIKRKELEVVNFLLSKGADTAIENSVGKTPLQLAEECKVGEIIGVLEEQLGRMAELIPSESNSDDEMLLSVILKEDNGLILDLNGLKEKLDKFYANKQLPPIDQLKATPPYPTPHVLAQFANMAYSDCEHGDPKPPAGWQLLTTASNRWISNGYFGTAYWHPEHQQVVIAHRGTKFTNIGAIIADIKGVLFNQHAGQINSASTFAHKVVAVLQEIERDKNVSFELFFTGHSLGGWLAQITTFTTEYPEVNGGGGNQTKPPAISTVQDNHDGREGYHSHTVVFESPGCKKMLSRMREHIREKVNDSSNILRNLDITSYLSAPNLINTCRSHLGTIYRIFIDLSRMNFIGKYTTWYNKKTHSIKKIVEAFAPKKAQDSKDDKGEMKIREVVRWPLGKEQYNDFFKKGKHKNNYHPEDQEGYETKDYDERAKSLSVFTQDQQEFLVHYFLFRHVSDKIEFQELFSELKDAEVKNVTKEKLQNFELDKKRISCPDASELDELIPYVKRLVGLFPGIKENLLPQEIIKKVCQYETQGYIEKMKDSALDFNPSALDSIDFLTSDKQFWHLQMPDGDAKTGLTKVYQFLQHKRDYFRGQYNVLKINWWLLTVNRMINLNAVLMSMETPHLLIRCGEKQTHNKELRDMFKNLFSILKQKKTMKIIMTTKSKGYIATLIQEIATETLGEGFITTDKQLTWSDLTASSQRKMLEKTVIFQGNRIALNQLISAESIADSFPLADLLKENEIRIGEQPVPSASSGYNEKCYVDRTFNHNIVIRQEITDDKRAGKFVDLLASTELEFKQLCQQNPEKNVHWLEKDKSGELVWQQSQGNLQVLRKYIDVQKYHSYAPSDLDKLLQQAKHQRVMIIAGKAGMGKTTVLTHLAKCIKEKFPADWLVRIYLNNCTDLFMEMQRGEMDKERIHEFISKEVLKLESHLEKELFKKSFEADESSKVVVMVDGFDKISPKYKETFIDMLKVLKQTSLEQLWVTARPHLREELEDNLQQLSYTLQPFSKIDQVEFLKNSGLKI